MARGRRSRKDESFIGVLLTAPWQVSVAVGVAVFVGLKWGMPALVIENMFLKPVVLAASGSAWMFAAVFFLIGAIVFAKDKSQPGGRRVVEPTFGGPSVDRMGAKSRRGCRRPVAQHLTRAFSAACRGRLWRTQGVFPAAGCPPRLPSMTI